MLRLRTFGGLAIESSGRTVVGTAAQRRRLALLVLLASGSARGLSRDKLFAYLWPDSDIDRARNILNQALFAFRRDLGPEAVVAQSSGELKLNLDLISCDVVEFDRAVDMSDLDTAVRLYAGPFLDGFHLPDAPEFERWADAERRRLSQRHADALESVASGALARGDIQAALAWYRRLASVDPTNSRVALGLMNALAASGDRGGAIKYARLHEILLREELGVEPDETVVALADRLRSQPSNNTQYDAPRSTSGDRDATAVAAETSRISLDAFSSGVAPDEKPATPPLPAAIQRVENQRGLTALVRRPRVLRRVIAVLAPILVVGLALVTANEVRARASRRSTLESGETRVAILPFSVHPTGPNAFLGDGLVELLARNIDAIGGVRAVDARPALTDAASAGGNPIDARRATIVAERLSADRFVLGSVVEISGDIRLTASVYDRRNVETPVGHADVAGPTDQLLELIDKLSAQLLSVLYDKPHDRLARTAAVTTGSLPALKAYLKGESHVRAHRWADAIKSFQDAIKADSNFALAYYRLTIASDWGGRPELRAEAIERAYNKTEGLAWHDSVLIRAYRAWYMGDINEADHLYRSLVQSYPDDIEAWYQLGEVLFHGNPTRGRPVTEARLAFEQVVRLRPDDGEALQHLFRIAAREGRSVEIDSLADRLLSVAPPGEAAEVRALHAFTVGDSLDQSRALSALHDADDIVQHNVVWRLSVFPRTLAAAERVSWLMIAPGQVRASHLTGREYRADLFLARGRRRDAHRELEELARIDDRRAARLRALFASISVIGVPRSELATLRDSFGQISAARDLADSSVRPDRARDPAVALDIYFPGLLSARIGDSSVARLHEKRLEALARSTDSISARLPRSLAASLRAQIAWAAGDRNQALVALQPVADARASTVDFLDGFDRFALAELLRESGRLEESLGWYESIADVSIQQLPYLGPSYLRLAQVYERLGNRRRATEYYRRFVDFWSACDADLAPLVAEARRHLR